MQEKLEIPTNDFPYALSTKSPTAATAAKYRPIREGAPIVRHERFPLELAILVEHVLRESAISESKFKNFYAIRKIRDFVKFSTHHINSVT